MVNVRLWKAGQGCKERAFRGEKRKRPLFFSVKPHPSTTQNLWLSFELLQEFARFWRNLKFGMGFYSTGRFFKFVDWLFISSPLQLNCHGIFI